MNDSKSPTRCAGAPRDRANGRRVMLWSIGWATTMLLASAAISFDQFGDGTVAFIAAGVSLIFGAGTVGAYRQFLNETDELRQKVELEALAVAFGFGVVGGMAYAQISRALGLGDPRLAIVIAGMLIVHAIGVAVGMRRYA